MSEPQVLRLEIVDARARFAAFRALSTPFSDHAGRPSPQKSDSLSSTPDPEQDFLRGFAEGRAAATKVFLGERAELQALLASAQAFQPEPSEELALLIVETVSQLVETITGITKIDRDTLNQRARRAAAVIADADAARSLHLHPEDVALIDSVAFPITIVADADLSRGTMKISCSNGWVEDGIAIYLDALRDALGQKDNAA